MGKVYMKKKKKNKWILRISIIIGILIIAGSIFTYILYKDLKQEDILRNEVSSLSKKDFSKDNYNTSLKTKGDYRVVEKVIKDYFDEYAKNLQDISLIASDKTISGLLSTENFKNDGPDFVKTKKYLNETRTSFNTKIDELSYMTSESEIMKRIENKNLDSYYTKLYKELMIKETTEEDFKKSLANINKLKENINKILDTEEAVIDLLISEKGKWEIKDYSAEADVESVERIVFEKTETLEKYNALIKDYQNKKE